MTEMGPDVIDLLTGIAPGSRLDFLRARRARARENAQLSYLALFRPAEMGDFPIERRLAVAVFVAGLHGETDISAFYAADLSDTAVLREEIGYGLGQGPYGKFPAGPLSAEDVEGPRYRVRDDHVPALGRELAAALEHAHLLVFHPRDADPAALQALLDAGWSTTGIVILSQLIAFLSFQIRVVVGLRALAAA